MESSQQTIRRLQKELKQKNKTIKQNKKTMKQNNKTISKYKKTVDSMQNHIVTEDTLWQVTSTDRHDTDASLLHRREIIHEITHDTEQLNKLTSYDLAKFNYNYNKFVIKSKKDKNAPLFAEDEIPDPGNRCLLDRRSAMLLALFHKRTNLTQDALSVLFGIDQATISRYLRFANVILNQILPTADKIQEMIKKTTTKKELKKLIPDNTIIPDGTEVARQRPQDSDARKNTYSGKKKRFTNNTTVITNKDGLIIQAGKTFEGGTHDLKMITDDPIDLGRWSRGMFKENTLKKDRLQVLADKGYQGLEKRYPGINLEMPTKKPPKGELTPQQKKRNKKISSKRIKVEHAIGRIKQWARMTGTYNGTIEEFEEEFMVCTGLANFALLWDHKKKRPSLDY